MDAIYKQKLAAGALDMDDQMKEAADCCADGVVNGADTTAILKHIVRDINVLPVLP